MTLAEFNSTAAPAASAPPEKEQNTMANKYAIPVLSVQPFPRPDLEAQGINVLVVSEDEHADHQISIAHGPNHIGHPKHRESSTHTHDFVALANEDGTFRKGNPVLIVQHGDDIPTDAQLAAYLAQMNEEVAPGAAAKAKGVKVTEGSSAARHDALTAAFGPIDIVNREVQTYANGDRKCRRLVLEFKPRTATTRRQHDEAALRRHGLSGNPQQG